MKDGQNGDGSFSFSDHIFQNGAVARGQWFSATMTHFYEHPKDDPSIPEIWCYTDKLSYEPGEEVVFSISTTAPTYDLQILRDGAEPACVHQVSDQPGVHYPTPARAYANGCGWPASLRWRLPEDTRSGGYVVLAKIKDKSGNEIEQQHFFIVRVKKGQKKAPLVLIAATSTWIAYNDWGGSNAYEGIDGDGGDLFSPNLSIERPWSRGLIWLPEGAPRIPHTLPPHGIPRYPNIEFAFAQGFAKYYAAAGWAMYERNFVCWAEKNNIDHDIISQHDLHFNPELLEGYKGAVLVGHDEYWSRAMRDNLDQWLDSGGQVARFGGNFCWQIRLEDDGKKQVCYKYRARDEDPVRNTDDEHLLTSGWEDTQVGHPGAKTLGLNGFAGIYVGVGATLPRSQRGFTVYRSDHWAFEGTDLYYGDLFGHEAGIYGFEVDGVEYTFNDGLPYPTYQDGAPENLEILAMGPATLIEEDHRLKGANLYLRDADAMFAASIKRNSMSEEALQKSRYGAGMIASFQHGKGEVFNAASCEWVVGLKQQDFYTEKITRNVLTRFSR
jgi:hypothetical protein